MVESFNLNYASSAELCKGYALLLIFWSIQFRRFEHRQNLILLSGHILNLKKVHAYIDLWQWFRFFLKREALFTFEKHTLHCDYVQFCAHILIQLKAIS